MTSKHGCNDASGKQGNCNRMIYVIKLASWYTVSHISLQWNFSSQFCTHCATNRQVAGLIPDGVGIFQ